MTKIACVRALLGAAMLFAVQCAWTSQSAFGGEVILHLKNGDLEFKGEFIAYDGTAYIIDTKTYGKMTLEAARFECLGPNCPPPLPMPGQTWKRSDSITVAAISPVDITGPRIAGSTTIGARLMPALVAGYARSINAEADAVQVSPDPQGAIHLKKRSGEKLTSVSLQASDAGKSFAALAGGKVEIAMADRTVSDEELRQFQKAGLPDMRAPGRENVLALDAAALIVSHDNPIDAITIDDIARIFSGKIKDWSELGRQSGPITLYAVDGHSAPLGVFKETVLKPRGLDFSTNVKWLSDAEALSEIVQIDPFAIGLTSINEPGGAKELLIASACGLLHKPAPFNVKTEEYPLYRRLYLYAPDKLADAHANALLRYALSEPAQNLIAATGFVDQQIAAQPFEEQSARIGSALNVPAEDFDSALMKKLIGDLRTAQRLSVTLRFNPSSADFDNKARQDLTRLVTLLRKAPLEGREILLLGFADSSGPFAQNADLSRMRAQKVKDAIIEAAGGEVDGINLIVKGYGELMPVGCNDTDAGKQKNRRVEVWIRRKKAPSATAAKAPGAKN